MLKKPEELNVCDDFNNNVENDKTVADGVEIENENIENVEATEEVGQR